MGVEAREHSGEGLSLIESWNGAGDVIIIDAVITGAAPGSISVWDANRLPPSATFPCSTHTFGLGDAVELARVLDRLPRRLRIYGIEAREFEPGRQPSEAVLDAVEKLAASIAREMGAGPVPPVETEKSNA